MSKGYWIATYIDIKDPAKPSEELFVHSEHLHAARRARGTDEDLIIIPWDQPQGTETRKPLTDSATAAAG